MCKLLSLLNCFKCKKKKKTLININSDSVHEENINDNDNPIIIKEPHNQSNGKIIILKLIKIFNFFHINL